MRIRDEKITFSLFELDLKSTHTHTNICITVKSLNFIEAGT